MWKESLPHRNWKFVVSCLTLQRLWPQPCPTSTNFWHILNVSPTSNYCHTDDDDDDNDDDDDGDELFLWYDWPAKGVSLISSGDHCRRSTLSRISNTLQAGFEPVHNLLSGFVAAFSLQFKNIVWFFNPFLLFIGTPSQLETKEHKRSKFQGNK